VVLPEPPFWLTMAMMVMMISFPCSHVDVWNCQSVVFWTGGMLGNFTRQA